MRVVSPLCKLPADIRSENGVKEPQRLMKEEAAGVPRISVSDVLVSIVDDDASVRRALERLLTSVGLRSVSYGSVRDYLESADLEVGGCLLLDLHLPEMSGMELIEHLSGVAPNIPVVCMTGRDEPEIERLLSALEPQPLLRKPFDQAELFKALSMVMGVSICPEGE
jgi:FixJ family two-component response regulator